MLKRHLYCLTLFALISLGVNAQSSADFKYQEMRVDEVNFTHPTNALIIQHDYLLSFYDGPAWKFPTAEQPKAFLSGIAPKVEAKFELAGCTKPLWAKGDGPGAFDPIAVKLVDGKYPATALPVAFEAGKVDYYDPFEVKWYLGPSENGPWVEAGVSRHPLYVVRPTTLPIGYYYHSLIYYGCKHAKGLTDEKEITNNIYTKTFQGPINVPRRDNPTKDAMSYWAWPEPSGQAALGCFFETGDLLRFENGRCGSWARFFIDMLNLQGVSGAKIGVVTYENSSNSSSFMTERSSFFGTQSSDVIFESYLSLPATFQSAFFVKNYTVDTRKFYVWFSEYNPKVGMHTSSITLANGNKLDLAPQSGTKAQGNDNPMSTFQDHAIVVYDGKYYDPSYGLTIQPSKIDYETASMACMGAAYTMEFEFEVGSPPIKKRAQIMYLHEKNETSTLELTIKP